MSSPEGKAARDQGIQHAADGAEANIPGWGDRAFDMLACFAQRPESRHQPFTSEDVRVYAAGLGLPAPKELRAWGSVFQRAVRRGLIQRAGVTTGRAANVHCTLQNKWITAGGQVRDPVRSALANLLDNLPHIPERNCSCHLSPPCSDCVDWSGLREAEAEARAALGR